MAFKQVNPDSSHFITLVDSHLAIFTPASVAAVVADSTATLVPLTGAPTAVGALLKDMGKTVVAMTTAGNQVTFRAVQVVSSAHPETNGIAGATYGDGYIMLGLNGAPAASFTGGALASVAKYGL